MHVVWKIKLLNNFDDARFLALSFYVGGGVSPLPVDYFSLADQVWVL